ncbi:hypothetical protein ACH5RR_009410 [Cinchona calisaya]|uniref:Uncharacterized protein n=1 Tax=Cinchona calisaya TaxID=153742 RepID=A0ABD3AIE2_9GENT
MALRLFCRSFRYFGRLPRLVQIWIRVWLVQFSCLCNTEGERSEELLFFFDHGVNEFITPGFSFYSEHFARSGSSGGRFWRNGQPSPPALRYEKKRLSICSLKIPGGRACCDQGLVLTFNLAMRKGSLSLHMSDISSDFTIIDRAQVGEKAPSLVGVSANANSAYSLGEGVRSTSSHPETTRPSPQSPPVPTESRALPKMMSTLQGVLSPSLSGSSTSVQSSSSVHSMSKSLLAKLSDRVKSRGPPPGIEESLALACLPVLISCKNKGKH